MSSAASGDAALLVFSSRQQPPTPSSDAALDEADATRTDSHDDGRVAVHHEARPLPRHRRRRYLVRPRRRSAREPAAPAIEMAELLLAIVERLRADHLGEQRLAQRELLRRRHSVRREVPAVLDDDLDARAPAAERLALHVDM